MDNHHDQDVGRWLFWSLTVGIAASAVSIGGLLFGASQFYRAYLFSYLFVAGLALGSLSLVMIHQLTGGAWGYLIRRLAEAQLKTLPLVAVLFVPIVVGLPHIYAWAAVTAHRPETRDSFWAGYLDPRFFCLRAVVYFVVWLVLTGLVSAWSRRQDDSDNARVYWKLAKISGFGLLLIGITLHFASMDWVMSVQPGFTSTILGPLVFSSQLLSAYALSVMLFCCLATRPEYAKLLSSKVMDDLGSLLFTLLVLWAYLAWFQFMLIWIADLPRGNVWYLVRGHELWKWLMVYLVVVHGVAPFVLLLFRVVKQNPLRLGVVAAVVFAGQCIFVYEQIMPAFGPVGFARNWIDFAILLGMGGIWFACALWNLSRRPLLPVYDLNHEQAVHLRELDLEQIAREESLAHV